MLKVSNLRKVFIDRKSNEIEAVKDLNLSIEAGQILGLLGMNGAGKSTALRMLSTVIKPSSGQAFLNDVDMHANSLEVRRSIGFLSGSTGLYKRLTARETIVWFAKLNGMGKQDIKTRVDELVVLLNMSEFIDRKCEKLSTGQKQKVNIARTIIHNPSLLILDEATTGLDVVAKRSIIDFIKHMKNENRVILFCTHHMDEVLELCDSIAVLNQGELVGNGQIDDVLQSQDCSNLGELFNRYAERIGVAKS
ncbi:MAG: ATP-binding cassette domain-containing protein [Lentisphaeraceae bacterium]|nr:ATP-binding cassette domain-containing protein [Lentisphaeraceae bacterium]